MRHEEVIQQIELAQHAVAKAKLRAVTTTCIQFIDNEYTDIVANILLDSKCTKKPVKIIQSFNSKDKNLVILLSPNKEVLNSKLTKKTILLSEEKHGKGEILIPKHQRPLFTHIFATLFALEKMRLLKSNIALSDIISSLSNFAQNHKAIQLAHELEKGIPEIFYWKGTLSIGVISKFIIQNHAKTRIILSPISTIQNSLSPSKTEKIVPFFIYPKTAERAVIRGQQLIIEKHNLCLSYELTGRTFLEQLLRLILLLEIVAEKIAKKRLLLKN